AALAVRCVDHHLLSQQPDQLVMEDAFPVTPLVFGQDGWSMPDHTPVLVVHANAPKESAAGERSACSHFHRIYPVDDRSTRCRTLIGRSWTTFTGRFGTHPRMGPESSLSVPCCLGRDLQLQDDLNVGRSVPEPSAHQFVSRRSQRPRELETELPACPSVLDDNLLEHVEGCAVQSQLEGVGIQ